MKDNNTTQDPNLPDDNDKDKSGKQFKYESMYGNAKKTWSNWHHDGHIEVNMSKNVEKPGTYEEIVDDLIAIISKLLKELSKRK